MPPHATNLRPTMFQYASLLASLLRRKMPIIDDLGKMPEAAKGKQASMVIWTTTPWTMPANVAVALNPNLEYAWVEVEGEVVFMAKDMLEQVGAVCKKDLSNILGTVMGKEMEFAKCKHPMPELDRESLVVMADYVTTEAGTGCVHTAPGHGDVDFETGLKYKLPILCPVDEQGKLTAEAGERFAGMFVFDANIPILKYLSAS